MARAFDAAVAAICCSVTAVLLVGSLDHQLSASGAPTVRSKALQVLVPLPLAEAATVAFFAAAASVFRHLRHGGGGNRRLSELVTFTLCASVGILQFVVVFVQPPEGVFFNVDVGALGLAAARELPSAAAATFSLGMALVFAMVRAGGGGPGGAVAGDGAVHGAVWILSNVALGAAAAVVGLMAVALYTIYI